MSQHLNPETTPATADLPWTLTGIVEFVEEGHGEGVHVTVAGFGEIAVERWSTENSSGTDVYERDTDKVCESELIAFLGERAYDYLIEYWVPDVIKAYFDSLERAGLAALQAAAYREAATLAAHRLRARQSSDGHVPGDAAAAGGAS